MKEFHRSEVIFWSSYGSCSAVNTVFKCIMFTEHRPLWLKKDSYRIKARGIYLYFLRFSLVSCFINTILYETESELNEWNSMLKLCEKNNSNRGRKESYRQPNEMFANFT